MSPKNNYDGFFSKKDFPNIDQHRPSNEQIMQALMALAGQHQFFYKDEKLRLIVCSNINYLTNWMVDEKEAGRNPNIHVGYAAFMMMLAQVMEMTYDEFAGDIEREKYPLADDEDDFDF